MRHCTPDELMDVVEGLRDEASLPHLATCATCREELRMAVDTLAAIQDVDVPEPPPFALEQLSARVSAAVAAESGRTPAWHVLTWRRALPVVGLAAALVLGVRLGTQSPAPRETGAAVAVVPTPSAVAPPPARVEGAVDDASTAWMLEFADAVGGGSGLGDEAAAGAGAWVVEAVPGGLTDAAVEGLTVEEQQELARLIREAMGSRGA